MYTWSQSYIITEPVAREALPSVPALLGGSAQDTQQLTGLERSIMQGCCLQTGDENILT